MARSDGWVVVLNHGDAHYMVGARSACGDVVSLQHEGAQEKPDAACSKCALTVPTAEQPEHVEQPEQPARKGKK